MKGYKAFDKHMRGWNGYYFLPASEVRIFTEPKVDKVGFHFATDINVCLSYYPLEEESVVAEVTALGNIDYDPASKEYATDWLRIDRLLTTDEVNKLSKLSKPSKATCKKTDTCY